MERTVLAAVALAVLTWTMPAFGQSPPAVAPSGAAPLRQLTIANKPWTGDFDRVLERRVIRVNAPYSRPLFLQRRGS
jgi:hypothetical protein